MNPSAANWRWHAPRTRGRKSAVELERRGVAHGSVERISSPPRAPGDLEERFARARPILLRGFLAVDGRGARAQIEATRRWFERLRRGEDFARGARARLNLRREGARPAARITGISEDVADPLEIEKLHVDAARRGRDGKELYAKLSWIADDELDESLRVRFSFGSERSHDWQGDASRAAAADGLAEWIFPECALISENRALKNLLERLCAGPVRLSERIVYNNAPGGGASFHHDAEPRQLGVVYGQLCGSTGWLALPRGELALALASLAGERPLARRAGSPKAAMRALDDPRWPPLDRLLNSDPRLTQELVLRGAFFRLRAGDVLILPSPSRALCAWHSVFALGRRPSVAHSYGLFAARTRRS